MLVNADIILFVRGGKLFYLQILFPAFFGISLYLRQLFAVITNKIHLSPYEILILEIHVVAFFCKFRHFAELVHVQLTNERSEMFVPKEVGEDFLLHFFGLLYEDLIGAVPSEIVLIFFSLC